VPLLAHVVFGMVNWAARKGLVPDAASSPSAPAPGAPANYAKLQARATGIRGETYAYWYLRRRGYIMIARNYKVPGVKGELDLVGYDGRVLAFIEVKTRSGDHEEFGKPEDVLTKYQQHNIARMAQRFLLDRRLSEAIFRFDVLAVESQPGHRPVVRLHKDAFSVRN
jgi:putative endonuclease